MSNSKTTRKVAVATAEEIPPGEKKIVRVNKLEIGVFNIEGEYRAYRNVCPHAGAPVCEGAVTGTTLPSEVYQYDYDHRERILRCPWHGWEFDLDNGCHLVDSGVKLKSYRVENDNGTLFVLL